MTRRRAAQIARWTVGGLVFGLACGCAPREVPLYPVAPTALVPIEHAHDKARPFARVFCSVLTHFQDEKGHSWGDCSRYLETVEAPAPLTPLTTTLRFAFVGGFGEDCMRDVHAYSTAMAHLREAHQVVVERISVPPFGASEKNGAIIARHLEEGWASDRTRRYVLIGYSKGAADLLEALRLVDAPQTKVAALVTIAGTIGGATLPEAFRSLMQASRPWMTPECPANIHEGIQSLLPDVRYRFLQDNPLPVAGYLIAGATSANETSKALRDSWKSLKPYGPRQDGLLLAWTEMLPGATFLGFARADHWAIALPFDESPQQFKAIDRNRFPRDALLEAIVRFVSANLQAGSPPPNRPPP